MPVRASHTRAVSSRLAVAMREPSGLHDTEVTGPVWPLSTRASAPLRASQTRAIPSLFAVAMRDPSGLHDTEFTQPM